MIFHDTIAFFVSFFGYFFNNDDILEHIIYIIVPMKCSLGGFDAPAENQNGEAFCTFNFYFIMFSSMSCYIRDSREVVGRRVEEWCCIGDVHCILCITMDSSHKYTPPRGHQIQLGGFFLFCVDQKKRMKRDYVQNLRCRRSGCRYTTV